MGQLHLAWEPGSHRVDRHTLCGPTSAPRPESIFSTQEMLCGLLIALEIIIKREEDVEAMSIPILK